MKIIISPAKKLTTESIGVNNASSIQFLEQTKYLVNQLRSYNEVEIKQLMGLSDNLAALNYKRFQDWDLEAKEVNPAIFMFRGDGYKGLRADQFSEDELVFAQDSLRIISGLYGMLKPLDLIFPYRLEMGTNLKTEKGNNLYEFWSDKLSDALSLEMQDDEVLVNLASNEYSKALHLDRFKYSVVTPVFKDFKNGKLKVISFFAKKARGEMANFIIKNKIKNHEELKLFSNDGYTFSEESNGEILFSR